MTASDTSSLNTKLPSEEKAQFVKTAEALGMTPSAVIRVFVSRFNEYQGFPFPVRKEIPLSDEERLDTALLNNAIDNGTAKTYSSFGEILTEIDEEIASENAASHA